MTKADGRAGPSTFRAAFGDEAGRKHLEDSKSVTTQGCVVVRVASRGESYEVLISRDDDESLEVRSLHGPYRSRSFRAIAPLRATVDL